MNEPPVGPHAWWQRGSVYQIYPRSFADTNGDGIGDLPGVLGRLDYLVGLGVDALWLSPFYPSPMKDFGYDVADYTGVDPLFGTLADFDRLVVAAHARGLRVILDFVPNHSSDRHAWFLDSRSSRSSARRDWYLWRDPAPGGGPPNNWLSCFGGSAWQYDAPSGQYYYHAFLPEQPDLNWRNPAVVEAMLGVLRFWLDRGVDGFRVDVLWHLIKDDRYRDNPPNPGWREGMDPYQRLVPLHTTDLPEVHAIVERMRALLDEYAAEEAHSRVLIGEIYLPVERLVAYYGVDLRGAHLPFNFQLLGAKWDAAHLAGLVAEYERMLPPGAWPNWVLGNHDRPRIASRIGAAQARVAAILLLTLRGTPTLYYGDELGMRDVEIPAHRVRDPFERNVPGRGLGRDPARTPMPWSDAPQAGFSAAAAEPWLPLSADWRECNVAAQEKDPHSMLALYRQLIALRRAEPALAVGAIANLRADGDLLSYARLSDGHSADYLVVLNLGASALSLPLPRRGRIALSTQLDRRDEPASGVLALRPNEGLVVRLDA